MRSLLFLITSATLAGETITVSNDEELSRALKSLNSKTTLVIKSGNYRGGWSVSGIDHLTIKGDQNEPPNFIGGKQAWHFSKCHHLSLSHLNCSGQKFNGVNIDDGGDYANPTQHVTVSHLKITDIGPKGNFDALKCSGLDHLKISHSFFSGWGGQAIDFVGCHKSSISHCTFLGKAGFSQTTGPQFKGGCDDILIEHCSFKNAGQRPIQAGGSTGIPYFRPPGAKFEARNIVVRNNTIEGSPCSVSFTGVDGAEFTRNTLINPEKWIMRILQETNEPGFPPCRNVRFHHNIIVFERSSIRIPVNIGANTAPETFVFDRNLWFASDSPPDSEPRLPTKETNGIYGRNPLLKNGKPTLELARQIIADK